MDRKEFKVCFTSRTCVTTYQPTYLLHPLPTSIPAFLCTLPSCQLTELSCTQFALEYLTHPSLPAEFADEIVTILARHAKDGNFSLPLAYYHAAQPVFKTSEALDLLFGALARTSVTEALYFSRNHPESTRQLLFDRLIVSVLDGQVGSTRHKELVSLPFDRAEEDWFHNYLTEGDGKRLKSAAATVETRRIITGRHRGQVRLRGLEDNSVTARFTRPKPIR